MHDWRLIVDLVSIPALFLTLGVLLWWRIRAGTRANRAFRGQIDQQIEISRQHMALLQQLVAETRRIAEALERRGG